MFKRQTLIAWIALVAISVMPFSALAQTQIKYHSNKYSVQDDIKLGRQAAQEAESQFPLLRDETGAKLCRECRTPASCRHSFCNFNIPNFSITSKSSMRETSMRSRFPVVQCTSTAE